MEGSAWVGPVKCCCRTRVGAEKGGKWKISRDAYESTQGKYCRDLKKLFCPPTPPHSVRGGGKILKLARVKYDDLLRKMQI